MTKRSFFECKICKNEIISIGANNGVLCSQCSRSSRANANSWSVERFFECPRSKCKRIYKTDDFDRRTMLCYCGIELHWKPEHRQIHRFYHCENCDKNYESLAYRQTQLHCPNIDCGELLDELKSRTKYYGVHFGKYRCPKKKCKKTWKSAYAFKRDYQSCRVCKRKAYPHDLIEHGREGKESNKRHRTDLCGRCKIGKFCGVNYT